MVSIDQCSLKIQMITKTTRGARLWPVRLHARGDRATLLQEAPPIQATPAAHDFVSVRWEMSMPLHVTSFPVGGSWCDSFCTPPKRCHAISLPSRCASWAVQRTVTFLCALHGRRFTFHSPIALPSPFSRGIACLPCAFWQPNAPAERRGAGPPPTANLAAEPTAPLAPRPLQWVVRWSLPSVP